MLGSPFPWQVEWPAWGASGLCKVHTHQFLHLVASKFSTGSQQTAVLFISWHLVFNTFFTHTTWRSQKWISESAHVVISKWAETNSNMWSISSFLSFKRYVFCHTKLSMNHHRYFITLIALIYCIRLVICCSRCLTNRGVGPLGQGKSKESLFYSCYSAISLI